jgi:hypothetical protein
MSGRKLKCSWWAHPKNATILFHSIVPPPPIPVHKIYPVKQLTHKFWFPVCNSIPKKQKISGGKIFSSTETNSATPRVKKSKNKRENPPTNRKIAFSAKAETVPRAPTTPTNPKFHLNQKVFYMKTGTPGTIVETRMMDGKYEARCEFDANADEVNQWYTFDKFEDLEHLQRSERKRTPTKKYGDFSTFNSNQSDSTSSA